MPKPITYQRPIPVNRSSKGRPGSAPPFGNPRTTAPPKGVPASRPKSMVELRLDLHLPKLPPVRS